MRFVETLLALMFFGNLASAGTAVLGKEMKFYEESGDPKFGIQLVREINPATKQTKAAFIINFSVDGRILSEGKKVHSISWSLWDKKTESYLSAWRPDVQSASGFLYPGVIAFNWSTGQPELINEVIQNSSNLVLVLSVNSNIYKPQPTHFIDISSYCADHVRKIFNLSTGAIGCRKLDKPAQPTQLAPTKEKLAKVDGDGYCAEVAEAKENLAKLQSLPPGVAGKVAREVKLAKVICDSKNKFIGFTEIKDENIRAIVNLAAVERALVDMYFITREISPGFGAGFQFKHKAVSDFEKYFFSDTLLKAYPEIYGTLRTSYSELKLWAVDLANYYRSL